MSGPRIPSDIPSAVTFVIRTDNYLQQVLTPTNGTRLGLTIANVADHHTKRQAIEICFGKWSDKSQKTTPINELMVNLLDNFRTFDHPLLNDVAASINNTTTDEAVFNLVADNHHAGPTHRESKIIEKCYGRTIPLGGGEMANHVRTSGSSKRDHIFDGSTGFETAYTITDTPTPLTDPENATSKTYTKASVVQECGVPNLGKYLNHCERWVFGPNTKFNGPWSSSQSDLIG